MLTVVSSISVYKKRLVCFFPAFVVSKKDMVETQHGQSVNM